MRRHVATLLTVLGVLFASVNVAQADAEVVVRLRNADGSPADGNVTLSPAGGGTARSCQTQAGTCRIANVPAGRYVATVAPRTGAPPPPRNVVIPPSGTVTLVVSTAH